MMEIRLGKYEEIEDYIFLLHEFHQESPYWATVFDEDKVRRMLRANLANPDYVFLVLYDQAPVGLLIGMCGEMLFSTRKIATELVWYILPDFRGSRDGIRMLKGFEYWALEFKKADAVSMAHLGDDRLSRYYEKSNYQKCEEVYIKER